MCAASAEAGATFVVSPDLDPAVVADAHRRGMAAVPGAITPNEVAAAIRAGADAIKLFPVEAHGGVEHVRTLDGPYPGCRWVVSGGVEPDRVAAYMAAGCHAVCLGGALWTPEDARAGDVDAIARRTREVLALITAAVPAQNRR
jgi:2-dehydro-3-deoxyphosphogluconate aldolase/(4S)-4-hydroxy-2-oxoglutarate aldolase